jgi:hypothetical protein
LLLLLDGEPETVKPKNRFSASVQNLKTGSCAKPDKTVEPVLQLRTGTGFILLKNLAFYHLKKIMMDFSFDIYKNMHKI